MRYFGNHWFLHPDCMLCDVYSGDPWHCLGVKARKTALPGETGLATAGLVLGIIGTVFGALGVICVICALGVVGAAGAAGALG